MSVYHYWKFVDLPL